jgi:hypothetical protein
MRLLNKVGRNSFSKFSLKSVEYKNGDNQRFDRFSISEAEAIETSQFFSTFPDLMEMGKLVKGKIKKFRYMIYGHISECDQMYVF